MKSPQTPAQKAFASAKKEALIVVALVAISLVWTLGYCALRGYQHPPDSWLVRSGLARSRSAEDFAAVAGVPDWILYGIVAPWVFSTLATVYLSLRGMADDDLGVEHEDGNAS